MKKAVTALEAKQVAASIGLHFTDAPFDLEEFRMGMEVEFEHGTNDPQTNVTNDDLIITGKIAWAHLKEFPDYYQRLKRLEVEADAYWANKNV